MTSAAQDEPGIVIVVDADPERPQPFPHGPGVVSLQWAIEPADAPGERRGDKRAIGKAL